MLLSSGIFDKLSTADKNKAMDAVTDSGLTLEFVASFGIYRNPERIRERLLEGKDVSVELEFNDINISEEDRELVRRIQPILAEIQNITPDYPWLPEKKFPNINVSKTMVTRGHHKLSTARLKKYWTALSLYWYNGSKGPTPLLGTVRIKDGWHTITRNVEVNQAGNIVIGCQTISRAELEYVAREKGWEPVTV